MEEMIIHKELRDRIIEGARIKGNTLGSQYLCNELFLGLNMEDRHDRSFFNEMVNAISIFEKEAGRPMLGAIVVVKKRGRTGKPFFKMCEELGMGDKKELEKDDNFLPDIREACYDFWGEDKNYEKFKDVKL